MSHSGGLMMRQIATIVILTGLLVARVTAGARAQQPTGSGQQAAEPSGWTFNIAPYGWLANINMTSNLPLPPKLGGTVTTDSSIGFGNLLSHLNFVAMVAADAQYDRFSVLTDFMYIIWAAPLPTSGWLTFSACHPYRSRAQCGRAQGSI